jgi:VIT1/CCC1 family predicted Fe2+/Mn2+ transporter
MPLVEVTEQRLVRRYLNQAWLFHDSDFKAALAQILQDEKSHAEPLSDGEYRRDHHIPPADPDGEDSAAVTSRILHGESWHRAGGGFIKDAIYGVNDGLTANLGLVAGVAGATNSNHIVQAAGIAGMVAASVSMASGAYLSTKSQREIYEEQVDRERQEIEAMPEEEREELALIYAAKGLPREQARAVATKVAEDKDAWLDALSREELGLVAENFDSPRVAALSAGLSTFVGALIPIVWFFFFKGTVALLVSAATSLGFLFLVGSTKTLITARAWWRSGLEMVLFGSIAAVVTYLVGTLFHTTTP